MLPSDRSIPLTLVYAVGWDTYGWTAFSSAAGAMEITGAGTLYAASAD
jgi:hypothetical protein